jgi:moderate conductance mechanosensitive channel
VGLIIGLALFGWLLAASWIEYRLNPNVGNGEPTARVKTLLTIFRNAIAIALVVLTTMVVLAELGVNIGPLIAGAGVLGLAIGFGSQKLVQDVITGLFIQLEGAINVGDLVTAGGTTGTVEKLTIRSLGMRDLSGTYHLMPFSTVDMVSNFNREFAYHVGEYGVAYREDTDQVIEHLKAAFEELRADPAHGPNILADLEVHGVTALADSSVNVRVRIRTLPGTQFATGRAYNRLVKRHFDAAGIEIPFPHMTLYFGEDKQGKAPPANLRIVAAPVPDEEPK